MCPNCGSRNTQIAKQESNGWQKEITIGNKPMGKKKKSNSNRKKVAIIPWAVLAGIVVIFFSVSQVRHYLNRSTEAERLFEEKGDWAHSFETDEINDGWQEDAETVKESEVIEASEIDEESEAETLLSQEQINKVLQRSQNVYGAEWQKLMFPLLDQLYEQNQYKPLFDIYVNTKTQYKYKPIAHWEHYIFMRTLFDVYDIETVLEAEATGKIAKEWQYTNILTDYFAFEDFENRTNISQEEKDKLMPYVKKLREDAISRWNLSEKEWEELRKCVISEYNSIIYEEAELFVEAWMETKGYADDGDSIEEEIINSIDLDEETWKKRFYPKLDKLYEQGTDEELYNACQFIDNFNRSWSGWKHKNYVEMLEYYYTIERVWAREEKEIELDIYDYSNLLYVYLIFEHWENRKQLSEEERERLVPYREKILQDGSTRWNFTKEQEKEIEEIVTAHKGEIFNYEVRDFIERWTENE